MNTTDTKSISELHKEVGHELLEKGWGELPDMKSGAVRVIWGAVKPEARKEGWFILKSKQGELVLNKHQLQYLLRNV